MMMMMMMMINCLSTDDDNQLPVCFIATLYQAKMFIVEGHWQLLSHNKQSNHFKTPQ